MREPHASPAAARGRHLRSFTGAVPGAPSPGEPHGIIPALPRAAPLLVPTSGPDPEVVGVCLSEKHHLRGRTESATALLHM